MGMNGERSNFLLYHNTEDVFVFDAVLCLIKNTERLEHDNGIFNEEPDFSVPLYEFNHKELYSLMWYIKYGESLFLPEHWTVLYYMCDNKCKYCSSEKPKKYYERYQCFSAEDVDKLHDVVFDIKNYCVLCRRALFDVLNVE
jgi:hypothetical protein